MAIIGFSNVLRLEGDKYGIKVNTIVPNAATRMSEGEMTEEMFVRLNVKYITPGVLCLSSEQYRASGMCINAFGSYFSRSAIVTGPGASGIYTAGQFMEDWDKIVSMDSPTFYDNLPGMVNSILRSCSVEKPE
jgi:hypothetical protein